MNFFNTEIQLKDTESSINNKPIDLQTSERVYICSKIGFRVWKNRTRWQFNNTKYNTFYLAAKGETIILESEIDDVSILWLYQTSEICS